MSRSNRGLRTVCAGLDGLVLPAQNMPPDSASVKDQ